MDVRDKVRNYIIENFLFGDAEPLADDEMSLLDGAAGLNMAAFYNEFDDVQVSTFDGGLSLKVGNAAETTVAGFEMDGRWALTDNFTVSGAMAYINAEYDDFPNAQCYFDQSPDKCTPDPVTGLPGQDLSGEDLQFSPDWSAQLGLEHYLPLGALELRSNLNLSYSDEYYIAADLDPRSLQDSFVKVDLRLAISDSGGVWELAFIGRNLTDEDTSTWANDTALAQGGFYHHIDRLRSMALQARFNF